MTAEETIHTLPDKLYTPLFLKFKYHRPIGFFIIGFLLQSINASLYILAGIIDKTLNSIVVAILAFVFFLILKKLMADYKNLTGDSLEEKEITFDSKNTKILIDNLFIDTKQYCDWLKKTKKNYYSKNDIILSIVLAVIIEILVISGDILKTVPTVNEIPINTSIWTVLLFCAIAFSNIIYYMLVWSIFFFVVKMVLAIHRLGKNKEQLSLSQLERFVENKSHEQDTDFLTPSFEQSFKISLRLFRLNCKPIASFMGKLSFYFLIFSLFISMWIYFLFLQNNNVIYLGLIILVILISQPTVIILFIFPQYNLHSLMARSKDIFMLNLLTLQEFLRFQFLAVLQEAMADSKIEDHEIRARLPSTIEIIDKMVLDVNTLLTWPFNYTQVLSLFAGTFSLMIPIATEIVKNIFLSLAV